MNQVKTHVCNCLTVICLDTAMDFCKAQIIQNFDFIRDDTELTSRRHCRIFDLYTVFKYGRFKYAQSKLTDLHNYGYTLHCSPHWPYPPYPVCLCPLQPLSLYCDPVGNISVGQGKGISPTLHHLTVLARVKAASVTIASKQFSLPLQRCKREGCLVVFEPFRKNLGNAL